MATTDMTMVTDTPITREEVAMLFTGSMKIQTDMLEGFTKKMEDFFNERLREQYAANERLVQQNAEIVNTIKSALSAKEIQDAEYAKNMAALVGAQAKKNLEAATAMKDAVTSQVSQMADITSTMTSMLDRQGAMYRKITEDIFNKFGRQSSVTPPSVPVEETNQKVIRPILDKSSLKAWKQDIWKVLDAIAPKYGVGAPMVCSYVYQKMKSKYGIDVDALFTNRKNRDRDTSKMLMCMHDARLGQKFEEALLDLYCEAMEKTPAAKKPLLPESLMAQRIPESIRMSCRALYPNLSDKLAVNRVYRKMEQISGLNLAKYIDAHRKDIEYKQFSKAYFVSRDKKLMSIFDRAVKELREG